eukprot:m.18599 g.18599  ORF g.18599 m.18599 type:complete len:188 (+) comp12101_c0_seq1:162-725(+)
MPFFHPIEIKPSPIEGHGVYAAADIPSGSKIWGLTAQEGDKVVEVINNTCPHVELNNANRLWRDADSILKHCQSKEEISTLLSGGYPFFNDGGAFLELRDGGQMTNHSATPNVGGPWPEVPERDTSTALRDIKAGEEILDDYGTFHDSFLPWVDAMMKEYVEERHTFEHDHVERLEKGTIHTIPTTN